MSNIDYVNVDFDSVEKAYVLGGVGLENAYVVTDAGGKAVGGSFETVQTDTGWEANLEGESLYLYRNS